MNVKIECRTCHYCLALGEKHLCYFNPPTIVQEGQARPEVKLTDFCSRWEYCKPMLAVVSED